MGCVSPSLCHCRLSILFWEGFANASMLASWWSPKCDWYMGWTPALLRPLDMAMSSFCGKVWISTEVPHCCFFPFTWACFIELFVLPLFGWLFVVCIERDLAKATCFCNEKSRDIREKNRASPRDSLAIDRLAFFSFYGCFCDKRTRLLISWIL